MMVNAAVVNALLATMNVAENLSWTITLGELGRSFHHVMVFGLMHGFTHLRSHTHERGLHVQSFQCLLLTRSGNLVVWVRIWANPS